MHSKTIRLSMASGLLFGSIAAQGMETAAASQAMETIVETVIETSVVSTVVVTTDQLPAPTSTVDHLYDNPFPLTITLDGAVATVTFDPAMPTSESDDSDSDDDAEDEEIFAPLTEAISGFLTVTRPTSARAAEFAPRAGTTTVIATFTEYPATVTSAIPAASTAPAADAQAHSSSQPPSEIIKSILETAQQEEGLLSHILDKFPLAPSDPETVFALPKYHDRLDELIASRRQAVDAAIAALKESVHIPASVGTLDRRDSSSSMAQAITGDVAAHFTALAQGRRELLADVNALAAESAMVTGLQAFHALAASDEEDAKIGAVEEALWEARHRRLADLHRNATQELTVLRNGLVGRMDELAREMMGTQEWTPDWYGEVEKEGQAQAASTQAA